MAFWTYHYFYQSISSAIHLTLLKIINCNRKLKWKQFRQVKQFGEHAVFAFEHSIFLTIILLYIDVQKRQPKIAPLWPLGAW